ncbi:MAG: L-threonylcarbamoyladenylate synthase [Candidatus Daviesbacteria bacterium]|nr:L-threonylcarbamoyladenylate synthase [Candidatus Daviesbacteria bacterium]
MDIVNLLKKGEIGVMPTDTIYGIVGSALDPQTVEKIYQLRRRSKNKPFIILISSINDLKKFDIKLTKEQEVFLQKIWPNPVSVILYRLAFRMPKNKKLLVLLREVGPLVAPSANIEGKPPAQNIAQAKKYFGTSVTFYIDGGNIITEPSTLIELKDNGSFNILRQGNFKI